MSEDNFFCFNRKCYTGNCPNIGKLNSIALDVFQEKFQNLKSLVPELRVLRNDVQIFAITEFIESLSDNLYFVISAMDIFKGPRAIYIIPFFNSNHELLEKYGIISLQMDMVDSKFFLITIPDKFRILTKKIEFENIKSITFTLIIKDEYFKRLEDKISKESLYNFVSEICRKLEHYLEQIIPALSHGIIESVNELIEINKELKKRVKSLNDLRRLIKFKDDLISLKFNEDLSRLVKYNEDFTKDKDLIRLVKFNEDFKKLLDSSKKLLDFLKRLKDGEIYEKLLKDSVAIKIELDEIKLLCWEEGIKNYIPNIKLENINDYLNEMYHKLERLLDVR